MRTSRVLMGHCLVQLEELQNATASSDDDDDSDEEESGGSSDALPLSKLPHSPDIPLLT